jgi:hypothetical protein
VTLHWIQLLNLGKLENYVRYALGNRKRVRVNASRDMKANEGKQKESKYID